MHSTLKIGREASHSPRPAFSLAQSLNSHHDTKYIKGDKSLELRRKLTMKKFNSKSFMELIEYLAGILPPGIIMAGCPSGTESKSSQAEITMFIFEAANASTLSAGIMCMLIHYERYYCGKKG